MKKKSSKWFRHPWLPSVPVGGFAKLVFWDAIVHSNYMHAHKFDDRRNFGFNTVDICTNRMQNCGKNTVTGREWLLFGNYDRLSEKNRTISHIVAIVMPRNCFWLSNYLDECTWGFFYEKNTVFVLIEVLRKYVNYNKNIFWEFLLKF